VAGDLRGGCVALVANELVNPPAGSLDALAVLEIECWGVMQLPDAEYPKEVAQPLLEQVAEQAEEFRRHGYRLALIGHRDGLEAALAAYDVPVPPAIEPTDARQLLKFLAGVAAA